METIAVVVAFIVGFSLVPLLVAGGVSMIRDFHEKGSGIVFFVFAAFWTGLMFFGIWAVRQPLSFEECIKDKSYTELTANNYAVLEACHR